MKEESYKAFFLESHTINLLINPENGHIVDANNAACEYYGYSKEEITSLHMGDINALSQAEVDIEMRTAREEKRNHYNFIHKLKSGELREVSVYSEGITLEGEEYLYTLVFDRNYPRKVDIQAINENTGEGRQKDHAASGGLKAFLDEPELLRKTVEKERSQFLTILHGIPELIYISDYETSKVLFTNRKMQELIGRDVTGEKCYEAIQGRTEVCDFCTNPILFKTKKPYCWEHYNPVLKKHFYVVDQVIEWIDGRDVRFEVAIDITKTKEYEEAIGRNDEKLKHRLRYEESLASFSSALLLEEDDSIETALSYILDCSGVSRVYIFENFIDEDNILCLRQTHEVCAEGEEAQLTNPELQHVRYREDGLGRWEERLSQNKIVSGYVKDFPEGEREVLEPQHILSILVIPVWVEKEWFGIIGFDDTQHQRSWDNEDIGILRTAAEILGTFIEKQRYETKLKESREQFALAVDGTNEGIWDWDIQTNELFLSPRWKEILGYEDWELNNEFATFEDNTHPEDIDGVYEHLNQYFTGKIDHYDIEFRMLHKDGTYRWIQARGKALRDGNGNPYRMAGSHADITERKKVEKQLLESRAMLQSIIDILPGTLTVIDRDYRIVALNREKKSLHRTSTEVLEDAIGKKCYQVLLGRSLPCSWCKAQEVLETGVTIIERTEPGDPREEVIGRGMQYYLTPLLGESGEIQGVVEYGMDITELRDAKTKAEEANKAKSEFLANMSHEIRTPLNGVIGFTELLGDTELSRVQQQYVEAATTSARSLLTIINDILDFSKIEAGKLELEYIKTDIITLLEESMDIIAFPANKKGLELLLNIDPKLPRFAKVDPIRLKQIIINLLSNAIKFTEEGEVELKAIFSKGKKKKGEFHFYVRDTGIGIGEEQREKLFKAFSQADTSTTRKFGGTGLGLVISHSLAEKMGGHLDFNSEPGMGTIFHFSLLSDFSNGEANFSEGLKNIKKILVIDDNANNRRILRDTLTALNIECLEADNGYSGIEIIQEEGPFDVIILDFNMPDLDGINTIRLMREKLKLTPEKQAVILLHSSAEDAFIQEECKSLGVSYHLVKPIKLTELYKHLNKISLPREVALKEGKKLSRKLEVASEKEPAILIAEDIPMNLTLTSALLQRMVPKARLLKAKNGAEALKLYKEKRPDLIFMDIQMPVLNGIETTERIRELEKNEKISKPVIIIALTAGVIKEEESRARGAGMDGFLSKPIQREELQRVLADFLGKVSPQAAGVTTSLSSDISFDREKILENVSHDEELLKELIEIALDQFPQFLDSLEKAVKAKVKKEIAREAHSLKGAALNMRFNRLAELSQKIEAIQKEGGKDARKNRTKKLLEEIISEWRKVEIQLQSEKR